MAGGQGMESNGSQLADGKGFSDGKADGAFRTIGEVADALGIRRHVLRYWEDQFPMLRPLKRSGGRRLYRPEDVRLVETIDRLVHREGYTLRGARLAIETEARPAKASPGEPPPAATINLASELRTLRAELVAALAEA